MTEIILGTIIIALILVNVFLIHQYHAQEKKLIKALLSKNVQEFTDSELAEKPRKEVKTKTDDAVLLSDLTDDEFTQAIQGKLKKNE